MPRQGKRQHLGINRKILLISQTKERASENCPKQFMMCPIRKSAFGRVCTHQKVQRPGSVPQQPRESGNSSPLSRDPCPFSSYLPQANLLGELRPWRKGKIYFRARPGISNTAQHQAWTRRGNEIEIKVEIQVLNWTGLLIIKNDQKVIGSTQDVIKEMGMATRQSTVGSRD